MLIKTTEKVHENLHMARTSTAKTIQEGKVRRTVSSSWFPYNDKILQKLNFTNLVSILVPTEASVQIAVTHGSSEHVKRKHALTNPGFVAKPPHQAASILTGIAPKCGREITSV